MTQWTNISNKWNKLTIQNPSIHWSTHYSVKYAYASATPNANPSPDVHFNRMFGAWFVLAPFVTMEAAERLQLY